MRTVRHPLGYRDRLESLSLVRNVRRESFQMQRIDPPSPSINPIAELRLRRWARENYVPEHLRDTESWHPVVLDEMQRKDDELRQRRAESLLTSTYVPLVPSPMHSFHTGHAPVLSPSWTYDIVSSRPSDDPPATTQGSSPR